LNWKFNNRLAIGHYYQNKNLLVVGKELSWLSASITVSFFLYNQKINGEID